MMGGWKTPEQRKAWENKNRDRISLYKKRHREKYKEWGLCVTCGKPVFCNRTYCEKCLEKIREKSLERYYKLSKLYKRSYSAVLKLKRKVIFIEMLGGKCIECGISNSIVLCFHHKEGRLKDDKGWWIAPKKFANMIKEGKIELLCMNCHTIKHAKSKKYKGRGKEKRKLP